MIDLDKKVWDNISVSQVSNIVEKNDELVVEDAQYQNASCC